MSVEVDGDRYDIRRVFLRARVYDRFGKSGPPAKYMSPRNGAAGRAVAGELSPEHMLVPLFGNAVCLKVAADGRWEEALAGPLQASSWAGGVLERWLHATGRDVSFEVGFDTLAFSGVRLRRTERGQAPELLRALLYRLTGNMSGSWEEGLHIGHVLNAIDASVRPHRGRLAAHHAEVGVLDQWMSVGSVRLGPPPWVDVTAVMSRDPVGQALCGGSLPGPLMVEVAYGSAADRWLALAASNSEPSGTPARACPLSPGRVESLLSLFPDCWPTPMTGLVPDASTAGPTRPRASAAVELKGKSVHRE